MIRQETSPTPSLPSRIIGYRNTSYCAAEGRGSGCDRSIGAGSAASGKLMTAECSP